MLTEWRAAYDEASCEDVSTMIVRKIFSDDEVERIGGEEEADSAEDALEDEKVDPVTCSGREEKGCGR